MLGSNPSACQVSKKGRSGGEKNLALILFLPLGEPSEKSRGFGGRAPMIHPTTTFIRNCR